MTAPMTPPAPSRPPRFQNARSIAALVLREMSTTYGRSPGGYVWAILEPVGAIAVMSLAFSFVFRTPALGNNFPLFYATGYLIFAMFNDISNKMAASISFSKQFLTYPVVTFVDALAARFLLAAMTHAMVMFVVLTGIHVVYGLASIIDYRQAIAAWLAAAAFGLSLGTANCFFFTRFPVYRSVWSIVTRPIFIISCVIFIFESLPAKPRGWLWWNPVVHLTGEMRAAFYGTYDADYVSLSYVYAVSGVLLCTGLLLLRRFHRDLIER